MKYFIFSFLLTTSILFSQKLNGIVYEVGGDENQIPLPGVNIFWAGTQISCG